LIRVAPNVFVRQLVPAGAPCCASCATMRRPRCRRKGQAVASTRRLLSLAAGLLCCSTEPTASAFLLPGTASRRSSSSRGRYRADLRDRRTVGVSSLRSSFAGASPVAVARHQGRRRGRFSLVRERGGANGLTMGIPKLFRWLTDQYPVISQRLDQGLNEVSNIFRKSDKEHVSSPVVAPRSFGLLDCCLV